MGTKFTEMPLCKYLNCTANVKGRCIALTECLGKGDKLCPFYKKKESRKSINEIVQKCRQDSGRTLADISQEAGMSVPYICQVENGVRKCPRKYWLYWAAQGAVKAEDFKAYPNFSETNRYAQV